MEQLLRMLDERASGMEQRAIYGQVKLKLRTILHVFIGIYMPLALCAKLSFISKEERGLMSPAYLPFDWLHSTRNYYIATSIRFRDPSIDAEKQLEDCITDHKRLLEIFHCMEGFMSLPMFVQFTIAALNLCISVASLVFFVSEPMARIYFIFYAIAIQLQFYPSCYYGTDNVYWFGRLHYAAFSCNWPERKLRIFVERSLMIAEQSSCRWHVARQCEHIFRDPKDGLLPVHDYYSNGK
ncbi:blast:Odorant receptor 59a [Drosophila guanche]|uniref:Blast:Odorant receptor 59a n=1 Tax=Drosophila guanche TaxID=7266 RepID=A0A3B0JN76_DROGU|nr:blast:Odorant receptor 59a [Drosophila guanche]